MEKFHWDKPYEPFIFLLVLVIFLSYQLPSSAYTVPEKYFINCGSSLDINVNSRTFVGDMNSGSAVSFTKVNSYISDSKQTSETPSLYQTARIFRQNSSYEFDINTNGTHLVRLHFINSSNLSAAVFDVSASGILLLHNFNVNNTSISTIIKEFIFSIPIGKFFVYFSPQGSSFAFINAIEVFLVPPYFIDVEHLNKGLHTVHRINVGGPTLTPENDTLGRIWLPDDSYLYNPNTAKNSQLYLSRPNYEDPVNEFIAPDMVYRTAKEMDINLNGITNNFNVTWSFRVTRDTGHMIRVHFCDIVSSSLNLLKFFVYINNNFRQEIIPHERVEQLATPFFDDFVVDSDDSGFINISIGPDSSSEVKTAFLNGVEIMEMIGGSDFVTITTESDQKTKFAIIGSVLGSLAVVFILGVVLFVVLKHTKKKAVKTSDWPPLTAYKGSTHTNRKTPQLSTRTSEGTVNASSPVPNLNLGLKIPFVEIQLATNYFDDKLLVGKGGFGNVYLGTLRNGINVAVKRSHQGSHQGLPEFRTEIMVLSRIRHHHLVSMIGYCDENFEMILVYEFMEKGTLKDHLCNTKLPYLSWKQRLEICIGAAKGLYYLHTGAYGGIIHRDVKSTNILLDEKLVAKVADFGLSRTGLPDQTHVSTNVKGTFGYLDPEYFRTQQLTEKSDVYSFGVVLLEVLCARPAINPARPREQVNLAEWGMLCKKKGLLDQIVDPNIKPQINPNSLTKFAEVTEKCLEEDARDRPTMGDVAWDLEYSLQLQQTAVVGEPHEDSTSNGSGLLPLRILQNIPSIPADQIDSGYMPSVNEDDSYSVPSAGEVFSQLRINDAR